MEIIKELKDRREYLGLSIEELADLADLSKSNIRAIEEMRYPPRFDSIRQMAEAMGMRLVLKVIDDNVRHVTKAKRHKNPILIDVKNSDIPNGYAVVCHNGKCYRISLNNYIEEMRIFQDSQGYEEAVKTIGILAKSAERC